MFNPSLAIGRESGGRNFSQLTIDDDILLILLEGISGRERLDLMK
ncbi:hypothetical protein [Candidatus Protochlamydia sp. W-9]|nr:hypothetical protein [Candidatus Protochlamydia sp. W-9]